MSSSKETAMAMAEPSSSSSSSSPYRRLRNEGAGVCITISEDGDGDKASGSLNPSCVFDIPPKHASLERLKKWRQAALVLNASRRFRYTLNLRREQQKEQLLSRIRTHTQVIRAAILFKDAGSGKTPSAPGGPLFSFDGYRIAAEQLTALIRDHDFSALQQYGGVKGLATLLKTNLEKGIGGEDCELMRRRKEFGANTYPWKKGHGFWFFFREAWKDLTLVILMIAAAASLALGIKTEGPEEGWYDGASIGFAVILVVLVTAISDYRQSVQFHNLSREKRNIRLEVVRDGKRVEISIFDIVVGDVIPLKIGDQVPADGILISGHSLAIDESSMTGESKIIRKDQRAPFLMSGCKVADGYGIMLATGVGLNTEWGLLMASLSEDNGEETPLQVRLNGIATLIGIVGLTVAVGVLAVLLVRYFTGHTKNLDGTVQFQAGKTSVGKAVDGAIKILAIAVTIVVVAVPEGLPLAVTLTLAYSMRKMMADKALVRRLSACETMGSATTICSDKTGTLTLNQMTVVDAYVDGRRITPPDNIHLISPTTCSLLIEGISQNTMGSVYEPEDDRAVEISGSPTEKAILSWGVKLGMKFEHARSRTSVLQIFPFNSDKKRGGVALLVTGSEVHVHWKGAAEIVLQSCKWWLDSDGVVQEMDQNKVILVKKVIEDMAALSLRCIALAYRPYELENVPKDEEDREHWKLPEDNLIFLAIVGLKDPCRPGVKEAVQLCQAAGIKVRMVTGDNLRTAKAIAVECGILDSDADVGEPTLIEGSSFRAMKDKKIIAKDISV